ncbi:hypothetical protein L4P27_007183 [Pseudomonas aeruginosa]|nr:hypothetical protein [Pseudomonas aeruginosa]EKV3012506.1 hypothetical protein [Pseudomonas aeruginosa]EKV3013302.1 hypothetical protein [Pseudomonas aeruginosa]
MSWLESINQWDYTTDPIIEWFENTVGFHLAVWGWPAYVVIGLLIIAAGLRFPATRGMTSLFVNSIVRMVQNTIQLVVSLLLVQFTGFVAKLLLAQFHRSRRWLADMLDKAKG